MKLISETRGIEKLAEIRSGFKTEIREKYEHKATPCSSCESPGICCLDEHFVNVHITKLEAAAIVERLEGLNEELRKKVYSRLRDSIEKYGISDVGDSFLKTYACPLFEKGVGCLVHNTAKPLPCIAHACYEKKRDLPPHDLLNEKELTVANLNRRVYGQTSPLLPLPVAVDLLS